MSKSLKFNRSQMPSKRVMKGKRNGTLVAENGKKPQIKQDYCTHKIASFEAQFKQYQKQLRFNFIAIATSVATLALAAITWFLFS